MKTSGKLSSVVHVETHRSEAIRYYEVGNRFAESNQNNLAISAYTRAIACFPKEMDSARFVKKDLPFVMACYGSRANAYFDSQKFEDAIRDFEHILATEPTSDCLIPLGVSYFNIGQYDEAITRLTGEIARNPRSHIAYQLRAGCYDKQQNVVAAIEDSNRSVMFGGKTVNTLIFRSSMYRLIDDILLSMANLNEALTQNPSESDLVIIHNALGNNYYDIKKYHKAIEHMTISIQHNLIDDGLYVRRGKAFAQIKHWDKAIKDFKEALKLNKNAAEAHQELGLVYQQKGKLNEAKIAYDDSLTLNKNADIFRVRGDYFYHLKCYDDAIQNYTQSIDHTKCAQVIYHRGLSYLHRHNREKNDITAAISDFIEGMKWNRSIASHELAYAYFKNNEYQKAIEALSSALVNDPTNVLNVSLRGQIYFANQQHELALIDCSKALKLDENNPEANVFLGIIEFHRGNIELAHLKFKKAIECFQFIKPIKKFPSTLTLSSIEIDKLFLRGLAHYHLSEFEESISDYTRCIENTPNSSQRIAYHYNRGLSYCQLRDYPKTIADQTEALVLSNQTFMNALSNRAIAYHGSKQYQEAIEDCKAYLLKNPDSPMVIYNRGCCYYERGDYRLAAIDYETTLKYVPNDSDAKNGLALVEQAILKINKNRLFQPAVEENSFVCVGPSP